MAGMLVLGEDGHLIGLSEQSYDSEDLLQSLLASYPDLLAGEEMAPQDPRRWILVSRETGVPGALDTGARWSIDHLFLDQEGVPTLVEVKRSTDTRIRREVVGQMLDYAANAVVYLPVERLRAAFDARCNEDGSEPSEVLRLALGFEVEPEEYWGLVQRNLQAGRVRLVFVSDAIPPELRRIIEFLNGQMNPAEVYGVEIRQYVGPKLRTLVPRLIGRTADAGRAKPSSAAVRGGTWTVERFDAELERRRGAGRFGELIKSLIGPPSEVFDCGGVREPFMVASFRSLTHRTAQITPSLKSGRAEMSSCSSSTWPASRRSPMSPSDTNYGVG